MGTWAIPADLLARSRFVISPLSESTAALLLLNAASSSGIPWERTFRAAHHEAYAEMLTADPRRAALAGCLNRPRRGPVAGWVADFVTPPPVAPGASFDDELDRLLADWDDERVRAEIRFVRGEVPEPLVADPVAHVLADLLRWVWSATLASDWPRRRRVLEADVVARTARLATEGWSGVLATLGTQRRWLGEGRLQINKYDLPSRDLSEARELSFVPVHGHDSWVAWERPERYAIVYPVTGAGTAPGSERGGGLARLVGGNRARVLTLLDEPHSTSQLTVLTGLPLGSVGNHLRVLLDGGAVLRRRAGREVLYWRTSLGDALVAADR
jgi:DNA-binding transcriptional ArsR family regulator